MRRWQGLEINAESTGITESLSRQVNFLGALLGHVIREQAGEPIFNLVESLRTRCKEANLSQREEIYDQLEQLIQSLSLDEIVWIIRAYTIFFHLVNEAERQEITRINREREFQASPGQPPLRTIKEAVYYLKQTGISFEELMRLLGQIDVQPTLTAHPTEARRQSILHKQKRISQFMTQLRLRSELSSEEEERIFTRIYHQITLMFTTDDVRVRRLTVRDEIRNGIYFCTTSIWETVPQIYQDLSDAIELYFGQRPELPLFFRYRSWIGGDRDGNPFVTPKVTELALNKYRLAALRRYRQELMELLNELSISSRRVPVTPALAESLEKAMKNSRRPKKYWQRYQQEPYRLKIYFMIEQIDQLLKASDKAASAYSIQNFIDDLLLLKTSLEATQLGDIANYGLLNNLIIQARVFGFHLISLDLRQHSLVHEQVVTELLQVAGVVDNYAALNEPAKIAVLEAELRNPRPLLPRNVVLTNTSLKELKAFVGIRRALEQDPAAIGSYIVSMTHSVSDLLEVFLLAKETGLWRLQAGTVTSQLDVVPLFETIEDLEQAPKLMEQLFANPIYWQHLRARDYFQEIMLGYSDSNKDGGYWIANFALLTAQEALSKVCLNHKVTFRFFHGRGGTVARGGGRANQAILAMPKISQNGKLRFTEQGEVISFRYAYSPIAHRHLEEIVNALLQTAYHAPDQPNCTPTMMTMLNKIAGSSREIYRALIEAPGFWEWFRQATPIDFIGHLPIASRPISRKSSEELSFENLRVIPWVFAWIQSRYNLPSWYGTGGAFESVISQNPENLELARKSYQQWDFFRAVVDNAQRDMARTKFNMALRYSKLAPQDFHSKIVAEFEKSRQAILAITNQTELLEKDATTRNRIRLRHPYTDVLNLLQIELLRRSRQASPEVEKHLQQALFLSINGIAAGMQSTG